MANGWKSLFLSGVWEGWGRICRQARWRRARCKHTLVCIAHLVCCKIWVIWTNALAPRRTQTHLKCIHHQQHSQRRAGSTAPNELSQWTYTACALASFPVLPGVTVEFYLPPHTQKKQEKTEFFQLRERVKTTAPLNTSAIKQILFGRQEFQWKEDSREVSFGTWQSVGCLWMIPNTTISISSVGRGRRERGGGSGGDRYLGRWRGFPAKRVWRPKRVFPVRLPEEILRWGAFEGIVFLEWISSKWV